ncbi:hypothetical protein EDC01DRAFT_32283 [Geopyxis carbonaria]|nr:hypothetical protein EDC01DRAFT_32283 [Geopyxis carbonaria]
MPMIKAPHYHHPCPHHGNDDHQTALEERIMSSVMDEIRSWVSARARSKILSDYRAASTLRQARFNHFLQSSRAHHMSTEQLDEAHYHMEHDMDNDWRRCMQKYPQVLDHYYTIAKEAVRSGRGLESIVHGESSRSRDRSNSRESSAGASGGGGAHYTTRRSGGGRGRHSSSGGGSGWSTPRRVYTD